MTLARGKNLLSGSMDICRMSWMIYRRDGLFFSYQCVCIWADLACMGNHRPEPVMVKHVRPGDVRFNPSTYRISNQTSYSSSFPSSQHEAHRLYPHVLTTSLAWLVCSLTDHHGPYGDVTPSAFGLSADILSASAFATIVRLTWPTGMPFRQLHCS